MMEQQRSVDKAGSGDKTSAAGGVAADILAAGLGATRFSSGLRCPGSSGTVREIVACHMPDGSRRQLFCKFGPVSEAQPPAHRFGVAYEAQVYDQLLKDWADDVPQLHGALPGRDDANDRPGAGVP